jgi:hypothetical protein
MRIFCSTSNNYLHIIPIFTYLFNKFWGNSYEVTILGYNQPSTPLPDNFNFISLNGGNQQSPSDYARHLREFLLQIQDEYFIYTMEDTFLKAPVNFEVLEDLKSLCTPEHNVGRIDLTEGMSSRPTSPYKKINNTQVIENPQNASWRITCQVSIWNKEYMIKYLLDGFSPWDFEVKGSELAKNDGYRILGTHQNDKLAITKNEGVRFYSLNHFNLQGIDQSIIQEMKELNIL